MVLSFHWYPLVQIHQMQRAETLGRLINLKIDPVNSRTLKCLAVFTPTQLAHVSPAAGAVSGNKSQLGICACH